MPAESTAATSAPAPARPGTAFLSRSRVETAMARSAAGLGVVYLLQSVPVVMDQYRKDDALWFFCIFSALLVALIFAVVASVIRRWTHLAFLIFSGVFVVALISWPFAVREADTSSPWIYYLVTVATGMAAITMSVPASSVYLVAITLSYGIIRVTPAGGGLDPLQASLDSLYSGILGAAIIIIAATLRAASSNVDAAHATALARYSEAVREHALEAERVRVDAIVHDSVLTTLLSAARADSPEAKRLAATMAGNAIGHLREAVAVAPDVEGAVAASGMAAALAEAARAMVHPVEIRSENLAGLTIPIPVGEALLAAAVQAMVNSQQHAGDAGTRWVDVERLGVDGLRVRVGDDGAGFDPQLLPAGRLGVRVSILERVSAVGGVAHIRSAPGAGAIIELEWPV